MMFGVVLVGTYTSIFIAAPLLIYLGVGTTRAGDDKPAKTAEPAKPATLSEPVKTAESAKPSKAATPVTAKSSKR